MGTLEASAPRVHNRGAGKKVEIGKGKKREKEEREGEKGKKGGGQEREKNRKVNQHDAEGHSRPIGAPEKKSFGAPS